MNAENNIRISNILYDQLIPLMMQRGIDCVAVAASAWRPDWELLETMTASRVALCGKRKRLRGSRPYGATSISDYVWPEDNLHSTRTPVLCFVLKGPLAYQISDYVLHCQAGNGILIPAGVPHANGKFHFLDTTKMHQGSCTMLQMQPYQQGLCCWITHFWLDEKKQLKHNEQVCAITGSQVPGYIYQLLDEMQSKKSCWKEIGNSLLSLLMWTLYREMRDLPTFGSMARPAIGEARLSWNQIEQYIQENLAQEISIDMLARRAAMSRRLFTGEFRKRTGKTLVQHTTALRMGKAGRLLKETDLAIQEIAGAVGLKPNRLRILFHEHEGMSPIQYRHDGTKKAIKK